ncbi:hypothetical protein IE81DRAFT_289603 [Ceraceosorus guamensis]|uniref:NOT2/NOT3/NOT5 C-terminal domain-containing protein n=1 Tax=Ceraceosorus guamensis TaxID=1522189 RepID=A0A316W5I8_9BASI|nr:hypothetical protein IE81DRAFT_289603 [Ceraceosorus guamensis]PWN42915.1 hypothetical protein IE81DRAFT_289603 [Ceraceosorus guamensis]
MRSAPVSQVLSSPADRFGLLGLLSIIKMQDPDVQMLSLGTDLQAMGLSLEAPEALYSSLITPLSDNNMAAALQVEPEFHLPSCYNVSPPSPAHHKVDSFSDETLFFIFYSMPRDVMQQIAAAELYQRNWRFHVELQLWLTQNGEPTQKTPTYERGSYVFFDPRTWDKVSKDMVLMYDALEEKPSQAAILALQSAQQPAPQQSAQAGAPAQQQVQTPSLAQR